MRSDSSTKSLSALASSRWSAMILPGPVIARRWSNRLGAVTEKLTDKLFKNRYVEDSGHPHIEIANQDVCRDKCSGKYCNYFCPAGVYEWDEEKRQTIVSFGNCIECGACAIGCPYDNILCQTPRGGYGVQFQLG